MNDRSGPVAILAGSGDLPRIVIESLERAGRSHRILAFRGFAERSVRARADAVVDLLDIKTALDCLERWRPAAVTLAGGVSRPKPSAILGAYSLVRNQRDIKAVMQRGDDQLLRGVLDILEERGHRLVGVHELAPDLLATSGSYTSHRPSDADLLAIGVGMRLVGALSPFDVGQAAVVAGERVLAIEGPEGTDRMIARAGTVSRGFLFRRPSVKGVLVKRAKRGQDERVDLPAIGVRTLKRAAGAGLGGIAVETGRTLVIDRDATAAMADRLGLFLVGVEAFSEAAAG